VLHAIEGPITLANGKSIPPGNSTSFDKSARFTCGGIAFHLHASNAVSPRLEIRAPFKAVVASSAGVLALLALAVTLHAASPSSATLSNSSEITGSLAASVGHTKTVSIHEPSLMLPSLQRLLKDKGLDTVVLTTRADGAIEARGLILPQQKAAWQEIGHWFDSWAAGRTVLVDSVSVSVEEQPLALQSVWPGPNPYVIDGSGGKLFVGSVLANGWTISSIERTRVLMRRGDQTIAVKF
jgi:type III secretion protein D